MLYKKRIALYRMDGRFTCAGGPYLQVVAHSSAEFAPRQASCKAFQRHLVSLKNAFKSWMNLLQE